jgi:uncharacterized repeat protein (TIGR03803 family)
MSTGDNVTQTRINKVNARFEGGLNMQNKKCSIGMQVTAVLVILAAMVFVTSANAATEKVLHSFNTTGNGGSVPYSSLIFDAAGNLYGTAQIGGAHSQGTVFELMPQTGGAWTVKVLHSFNENGIDGGVPYAGVIFDTAGNLYGTTSAGGAFGGGTVFELTPTVSGAWMEKILHSFNTTAGKDGYTPFGGLIFDSAGNLYGTTAAGGANIHDGTVFELSPKVGGGWTEKILHSFNDNGTDGFSPFASLVFDRAGNLYGTTDQGGTPQGSDLAFGTVFELKPEVAGHWAEKVLHTFVENGTDGNAPQASLILDADGNLYGTTYLGGAFGLGTVFELTPEAGAVWTETVLHSFQQNGTDGWSPYANLILDGGNLYGTTTQGGTVGVGAVFELTPAGGGVWTESLPYSFVQNGSAGTNPWGGLILDTAGNLYGTTVAGGAFGGGTVFELKP